MTDDEKLGKVLKELIRRSNKTQAEVADQSGTDPTNLSRIISGKQSPPLARLRALGRVLGFKSSEILRMAEQGIPDDTRKDPRKAALEALIDALDPAQLDDAFRRWHIADQESDQRYERGAKKDQPNKKKAG